jgi:hypothetical protein
MEGGALGLLIRRVRRNVEVVPRSPKELVPTRNLNTKAAKSVLASTHEHENATQRSHILVLWMEHTKNGVHGVNVLTNVVVEYRVVLVSVIIRNMVENRAQRSAMQRTSSCATSNFAQENHQQHVHVKVK